jgi:hypothetical protein
LICEQALLDQDDERIARACVIMLGVLAVLIRRMSALRKAFFIQQVFTDTNSASE